MVEKTLSFQIFLLNIYPVLFNLSAVGFYCSIIHMGASFLCWLITVLFGLCGHRLDHQIPTGPEAYGSCEHSMVISSKSSVKSLSGQTEAQLFRLVATYWAGQSTTPPPLHTGRKKKKLNPLQMHTTLSGRQSNFSSDSCHFGMDY